MEKILNYFMIIKKLSACFSNTIQNCLIGLFAFRLGSIHIVILVYHQKNCFNYFYHCFNASLTVFDDCLLAVPHTAQSGEYCRFIVLIPAFTRSQAQVWNGATADRKTGLFKNTFIGFFNSIFENTFQFMLTFP